MKTVSEKRKQILEKELKRLVDMLIRNYSPEKIILFGSLANDKVHEWSDIDLVIIKETKERFIERLHKVHLMTAPNVGVNFIVYTPSEVREMIEQNHYFLMDEILKKGKVLYEKNRELV